MPQLFLALSLSLNDPFLLEQFTVHIKQFKCCLFFLTLLCSNLFLEISIPSSTCKH